MTEPHDPRPVKRAMLQLWVEIQPSHEHYAMKYTGRGAHEIGAPDGSYERVTPEDIAMEVMRRVGGRDLDGMWLITRVTSALDQPPVTVRDDDPQFVPKVVAALLEPPRPRHSDSRGECICATLNNPPCHWCSHHCCADHVDVCLAGFPPPCCDRCPDES